MSVSVQGVVGAEECRLRVDKQTEQQYFVLIFDPIA